MLVFDQAQKARILQYIDSIGEIRGSGVSGDNQIRIALNEPKKLLSALGKKGTYKEKTLSMIDYICDYATIYITQNNMSKDRLRNILIFINGIIFTNEVEEQLTEELKEKIRRVLSLRKNIIEEPEQTLAFVINYIEDVSKSNLVDSFIEDRKNSILAELNMANNIPEDVVIEITILLEEILEYYKKSEDKTANQMLELDLKTKELQATIKELSAQKDRKDEENKDLAAQLKEQESLRSNQKEKIEGLKQDLSITKESRNNILEGQKEIFKKIDILIGSLKEYLGDSNSDDDSKEETPIPVETVYDDTSMRAKLEEITSLSFQIKALKEKEEERKIKEELKSLAVEQMIELILTSPIGEQELKNEIKRKGFYINDEEYYDCLKTVHNKVNIISTNFNGFKNYTVAPRGEMQTLNLEAKGKITDVLWISDLHLTNKSDSDIIRPVDISNEFATINGIPLIANGGDTFDFRTNGSEPLPRYVTGYKFIERCINIIPRAPGVHHAILGGNHDKDSSKHGYDPVEMFTNNREDFINLGREIAYISINNIPIYMLYHLKHRVEGPVSSLGFNPDPFIKYFSDNGISLKKHYVTIIGGAHLGGVYPSANFITLPSLQHDRINNGAFRLQTELDSNNEPKDIIITYLSNDGSKLKPVGEMVYKLGPKSIN